MTPDNGSRPQPRPVTTPASDRSSPSGPVCANWHTIPPRQAEQAPLRCWWARPADSAPRAGVLVLPEVFGVNPWVRSVAERLAA